MSKLTLTDVVQGFQSVTAINANNAATEAALENTLSRDGTTPNTMEADLDMNSNKIQNLKAPAASNDAARWVDITDSVDITGLAAPSQTGNSGKMLGTDGSSTIWRDADNLNYNAQGNIVATNVGDAIDELDSEKVGLTLANTISGNNLFTGSNTFEGANNYAAAQGVDTYIATFTPALTIYNTGAHYIINFSTTSTIAAPTLNINGLGARTLLGPEGQALLPGQVKGDHIIRVGNVNLRIMNPVIAFPITTGTWTPTLQDNSLSDAEGQVYTVQEGTYVRIGNQVMFKGRLTISNLGTLTTTDPAYIAGLPFSSINTDDYGSCHFGDGSSLILGSAGNIFGGAIINNVNRIDMVTWDSIAGASFCQILEVSVGGEIIFSGQYTIA